MAHQSELIAEDIHAYLKSQEEKGLLRFITCGSVDDGKSTLIGRLLWDSKMVFEDQLAALSADSKRVGTRGRISIMPCSWTACKPSGSRASPSMWLTATFPPINANSSSPIRPAMSSTPATWSPAPRRLRWR
ncbi:MAG: hypothetical protein R2864_03375 [Syntrophotaleaceae bacterium]